MSALSGKKIVVLMGGPGSEREVSLVSARSVKGALASVPGVDVDEVDVRGPDFDLPSGTDLAFNVIHGTFGEDGQLQAILEAKGIPYTGAGSASSRLAFDKVASKERFVEAGVPTPPYEIWDLKRAEVPGMALPFVVKPPREGSSVGVHIVKDADHLPEVRGDVSKYGDEALVEAFISGQELTVGILGEEALPVVHICPRAGFYDMSNKYPWMNQGGATDYIVPAKLSDEVTAAVQDCALRAHRCLGVEVYSRVDVLLDDSDHPYVLEVNTIPGMTESSLLPKAAAAAGIDFTGLCLRLAEMSLAINR